MAVRTWRDPAEERAWLKAERQCWGTPTELFDVLCEEFEFELDAMADARSAQCEFFISPERDAMAESVHWVGNVEVDRVDGGSVRRVCSSVFLNPGFARPYAAHRKAFEQAQRNAQACVVVVANLSEPQLRRMAREYPASEVRFLNPRPKFVPTPGLRAWYAARGQAAPESNDRDCMALVFRKNPHRLAPRYWHWDWLG